MKNIFKTTTLLLVVIACFNCSSNDDNSGTDPDPGPAPNPNPNKTTTYNADVKTIIDGQCLRCHTSPLANGATFPMRNYQEIITAINDGRRDIVGRMDNPGRNIMPPEGRLPQETIDIMLDWEADGYLEE